MITIVSLNIANAVRDESNEEYRFGKRLNKLCKLIKEQNADIVLLQEIRQCRDESGENIITPDDIAHNIAKNTDLKIAGLFTLNPSTLSFARLTLYNPNTMFPLQCFGEWCSDTPNVPSGANETNPKKFGIGVQFTQFVNVHERELATLGNYPFWVANIHYPIPFEEKMYTNKYLLKRIPKLGGTTIIMGDFNTFFDNDGRGNEQINELKSKFYEESVNIKETFTTFPCDDFAIKNGGLVSSKLDHVFVHPNLKALSSCEAVSTKESRESDHYMIKITF